ncbi:MAG TPA: hypothetical protein VKE40_24070 [Gemmataceae bacterium]|nr:hypothetical protein [Gemmataceae bacterium]
MTWDELRHALLQATATDREDLGLDCMRQAHLWSMELEARKERGPDELLIDGDLDRVTFEWHEDNRWRGEFKVTAGGAEGAWADEAGDIQTKVFEPFPAFCMHVGTRYDE